MNPSHHPDSDSDAVTSAPGGSWMSPLAAPDLAAGAIRLAGLQSDGVRLGWLEGRPSRAGAVSVVLRDTVGGVADATPDHMNVRTLVHEYGGGAWHFDAQGIVVASLDDQRLHTVDGTDVTPLTPMPPEPRAHRFADPSAVAGSPWLLYVREIHDGDGPEPVNDIVAVHRNTGSVVPLIAGPDFVASPTPSPDGSQLAFVAWDHPNMPWDDTSVRVAPLRWSDDAIEIGAIDVVADGAAWQQPRWSPDGRLHAVGDPDGWWNIFSLDTDDGDHTPLAPIDAEFGVPSWAFANRTYTWAADGRLWATWIADGDATLGFLDADQWHPIDGDYCEFDGIVAFGGGVAALAAGPRTAMQVVTATTTGFQEVLHAPTDVELDTECISIGQAIAFETDGDRLAHAFYYPPTNPAFVDDAAPPAIVLSHGGPTGSSTRAFNLGIQYWTSRGFAVVDVNYGGSTGFGTEYRNRLRGNWGITDTVDCVRAAEHLGGLGLADPDRLVIKGGSAGGYTTLCALTFFDVFAAGVSRYGVADLETLARDTHKFESRYLDLLVGPWPDDEATYVARSPIHHTDRLSCPMIILQGSDDPIVPVGQAEQMVEALKSRGIPYSYVLYQGESHGFRAAENIAHALEAELSFLGQMLGFTPADDIDAVEVHRPA